MPTHKRALFITDTEKSTVEIWTLATLHSTIKQLLLGKYSYFFINFIYVINQFILIYLRYIGASNGYKFDSITLFEDGNFAGNIQAAFDSKYKLQYTYFGRFVQ